MLIKIGSFNVQNLKVGDSDGGSEDNSSFKKNKIEKIAEIIKNEGYDLVALQEIKNTEAVKGIAQELGYSFCHCDNLYNELNRQNYTNKNNSTFKPEYAFLWNPTVLVLDHDPEIYKGIYDRISLRLRAFIDMLVAAVYAMLIGGRNMLEEEEKENGKDEDDKKEDESHRQILLDFFGLAGTVFTADKAQETFIRHQISQVLQQTLRPSLIGVFKRCFSAELCEREIRLINVHTQFGKNMKEFKALRMQELEFVLGDVFDVVATQRDGKMRCATTIVAGDYNMELPELAALETSESFLKLHKYRSFVTTQDKKTTVRLANADEVEQGQRPELEYVSNYDHFSYDASLFPSYGPVISRFDATPDNFIIENKLVSDHVPVKMTVDF